MPGITNPAEAYFKDGQWGWNGTAWKKLPMVWGYSGVYAESEVAIDVAEGNHSLTFSVVPEGEVWVVTSWSLYADQVNPTRVEFQPNVGGAERELKRAAYPTAALTVEGPAPLILVKDDFLEVRFIGCALGDDLRANAAGYKMKIAE